MHKFIKLRKYFSSFQTIVVHLQRKYGKTSIMSMKKIFFLPVALTILASCASSYNVEGTSSVSALDGNKLYLKAIKNNEFKNIDSCDVVHGEFHFTGLLDTVRMATLFMDDESIMPVVLEKGEITITIDPIRQVVGGTPMNDSLYKFIDRHNQLTSQMNELSHKQSQMMLEGIDEEVINRQLSMEARKIAQEEDRLVMKFIEENFDNVLGPGVFMMITSQYRYPILTPQIEDIMSKATKRFKEDPYVKDYYQTAQENEKRMNGLGEQPQDVAAPAPSSPNPLTNIPQK